MTDALARTRVTHSFGKDICHSPMPLHIPCQRVGEHFNSHKAFSEKLSLALLLIFPYTLSDYPLAFSSFPLTFSNFPTYLRQLCKGFTSTMQGIFPKTSWMLGRRTLPSSCIHPQKVTFHLTNPLPKTFCNTLTHATSVTPTARKSVQLVHFVCVPRFNCLPLHHLTNYKYNTPS